MTTAKENSKRKAKVVSKPTKKAESEEKRIEDLSHDELVELIAQEQEKTRQFEAREKEREEQKKSDEMDRYVSDSIKETNQIVNGRIRNTFAKHSEAQKLCLAVAEQIISFKPEEIKEEFGGSDRMGIGRMQGVAINRDPFVQESLAAHGFDLEAMAKKHGKAKEINQ